MTIAVQPENLQQGRVRVELQFALVRLDGHGRVVSVVQCQAMKL